MRSFRTAGLGCIDSLRVHIVRLLDDDLTTMSTAAWRQSCQAATATTAGGSGEGLLVVAVARLRAGVEGESCAAASAAWKVPVFC